MTKVLGIIGAGEFGQQVSHLALSDFHYTDVVFFDDILKDNPELNVRGGLEIVEQCFLDKEFGELFIAIGYHHLNAKEKLSKRFESIPFGTIIHSSSYVDKTAQIGKGVIIYPRAVIDKEAVLSDNVAVNINATISHNSIIGAHSFIAPSVTVAGFVTVGEKNILGIGSVIIDNVRTAANVRIGASSLVTKNIDKPGVYYGNPAKFIRKI